jgi:hypothetical protein
MSEPDVQMNYLAEVHVRTTAGDLITIYHERTGPAGTPAEVFRAEAAAVALDQEPGGRVEGSRVRCY